MYVIAKVRLVKDTRKIQTKKGTRMQSGFGFADIDGENGLPVGVVAFGSLADELGKYSNGSTIRVSGIFKSNNYTQKDGTEVEGFQITLDGIAGIKAARGKYSQPKPRTDNNQQANQVTTEFYDDALPESF